MPAGFICFSVHSIDEHVTPKSNLGDYIDVLAPALAVEAYHPVTLPEFGLPKLVFECESLAKGSIGSS